MNKVLITGLGAVSCFGLTKEDLFKGLSENLCGFKKFESWSDIKGLNCHIGAEVENFDNKFIPRKKRRSMSKMSEMAYLATLDALADAGIALGEIEEGHPVNPMRTNLIYGSTTGSPTTLESFYKKYFESGGEGQLSTSFFKVMNHSVAANVALGIGYRGPLIAPSSACSTSNQALILGMELIKVGLYDVVVVGGADELHPSSVGVFDIVHAAARGYDDKPHTLPGPFDKNRPGLVVSEGAGVIVLESESHMKLRGGSSYGEILGGAYQCDGIHMAQPDQKSMSETMFRAIENSHLSPHEIDYVNAHATGTVIGDVLEGKAIVDTVGSKVPISSLKGHMGHSLAACGTLEVVASLLMAKEKKLIGNRNLTELDDELKDSNFLFNDENLAIEVFLSNNFAFGGMNSSLVVRCH
ncbi:MAG: beta-ketoacyl-[acyl-carrier-protein] synthase family protein [Bacteriovoracaceae bacterium]|jgi:3-oxoacyl-[acyl-carrier-protein] synthase II|nr:beta-ketoacyl-[acyl-carrier-protein] synthase family protein [Bacteriovoracaceae bacterium]